MIDQPLPLVFTLAELQEKFPRKRGTCGYTGYIPMDFVNANLTQIAKIVKAHGLRRIYRGPRKYSSSVQTLRGDAHSMVLYRNLGLAWQ